LPSATDTDVILSESVLGNQWSITVPTGYLVYPFAGFHADVDRLATIRAMDFKYGSENFAGHVISPTQ
jgi:hypothetical protein